MPDPSPEDPSVQPSPAGFVAVGPEDPIVVRHPAVPPPASPGLRWSKPHGDVPDAFGPARWPGFSAAFEVCNRAVEKYPPTAPAWDRYLFLSDLGDHVNKRDLPAKALDAFFHAREAETRLRKFGFRQLTGGAPCGQDDKQIMIDGTVEFRDEFPVAETEANFLYIASHEYKLELAGLSAEEAAFRQQKRNRALKSMISRNIAKRTEILGLVHDHHGDMRLLTRMLGLSHELFNPTLPGRTWLCTWPTDGDRSRPDVALVVAAPREILRPGMVLTLSHSRDAGTRDRDLFVTSLQGDLLLLNEEQRLAWGCSLNSMGRVYWAVRPGSEPARAGRKPGRPKQI